MLSTSFAQQQTCNLCYVPEVGWVVYFFIVQRFVSRSFFFTVVVCFPRSSLLSGLLQNFFSPLQGSALHGERPDRESTGQKKGRAGSKAYIHYIWCWWG